jgi:NDP-sugar pyrophosphorylase family protein
MKIGIIAAGKGERLALGGVPTPKPLIPVGGRPLIARIIDAATRLEVTSIACIVNDLNPAVAGFLRSGHWPVPVEIVVKTTPSSMESLFCLAPLLSDEPFVLFTVDVVCAQQIVKDFVRKARTLTDSKGVFALTSFVDDEKPLWAAVNGFNRITALGDAARRSQYVTAGFYYFAPDIFDEIASARRRKLSALREFLGHLLDEGYLIYGIPVPKTIDVDYPEDIEKAEAYLKEINEG